MPYADPNRKRNRDNARVLEDSRSVRDIASGYPGPGDLKAREACEYDLRRFLDTYFPAAFSLPWSEDHLKAIDRLQEVVLNGGLFAFAMPRGSGKTTISVRAAIWALIYKHRRFVSLVGATEDRAAQLLKDVKAELTYNERLVRDFRQVCYPLVRLENNARKRIGQIFNGAQTRIEWTENRLTFPYLPPEALDGPNVGGSIITVASITGAIRGQSTTLDDGTVLRPELVILDDPQTRESAASPKQNADRASIIRGDVLGMAGPQKKIAAMMPCTVIQKGDLADEFLDRKKNPEWSGQRTKMVYSFPAREDLWDHYREILEDEAQGPKQATEFYAANQTTMDEGSVVAWPERKYPDELTAIQHAMNLRYKLKDHAFFAEYQNEPLPEVESRTDDLTPDQIASKLNRMPRGLIPTACGRLTAFIDVQGSMLFWLVAAWEDDFTGSIIDYGSFPDQKRAYFTLNDAKHTLGDTIKAKGLEGQIYGGLEQLTDQILGREWTRDDGALLRVEKCPIDANWGVSTETIYQFVRQSKYPTILVPSHGKYVGASAKPMREWQKKPGDRHGLNWLVPGGEAKRNVSRLIYDTNWWKSFIHTRLATAMGDRGCLSLFGDKPDTHRLLADHLTAEFRVRTTGRGRDVEEWKLRPGRPDNHWLDCLVGSAVAASLLGVALPETAATAPTTKRKRVTFAELMARRNAKAS